MSVNDPTRPPAHGKNPTAFCYHSFSLFVVLYTHYPHPSFRYDVSLPLYCLHELYSLSITLFATRSQVPPSFSQIVFLLLSCPICFWISSPHINTHMLVLLVLPCFAEQNNLQSHLFSCIWHNFILYSCVQLHPPYFVVHPSFEDVSGHLD